MQRRIKQIVIALVALGAVAVASLWLMKRETKKLSPEGTYVLFDGTRELIKVNYCRPSMRGRAIFGGLVPYGKVWRTGANEATTIETAADLMIGGKPVKKGKYTLWTLPGPEQWEVYINRKMYRWGVDSDGNTMREPTADIAVISVPVQQLPDSVETFTIHGPEDGTALWLDWERTRIALTLGTQQ